MPHGTGLGRAHRVSTLSDFTHAHLAIAQYLLGDWEDVPISCERGFAITANGEGDTAAYAWEYAALSWLAAGRGEWAAALEHLHALENRHRPGGHRAHVCLVRGQQGDLRAGPR
ncbi:hypothetical protein ACFY2H_09010 [Streptomyces griseofuscus]|uniref:hypothetical protein n=1 Tax=Streptomyces griseofuscus TaxID=146922 RepID=UPI00369D4B39